MLGFFLHVWASDSQLLGNEGRVMRKEMYYVTVLRFQLQIMTLSIRISGVKLYFSCEKTFFFFCSIKVLIFIILLQPLTRNLQFMNEEFLIPMGMQLGSGLCPHQKTSHSNMVDPWVCSLRLSRMLSFLKKLCFIW